jgi:hypothetical protein
MALRTPPAFVGQIVVTASTNDTISWFEAGPFNLTATVAAGSYWPDALATAIANAMTGQSSALGATNTYTCSFSTETGLFTISRSAGSADWYPKLTTAESNNLLTGGKTDSDGDTLSTGQAGPNHCGFVIDAGYPSAGTSFTSDQQIAHVWVPEYPPETDSEETFDQSSSVVEAYSMNGTGDVYNFVPWEVEADEWPLFGNLNQRRSLQFAFVTQASSTQFLAWFWGPWAGQGNTFRYYPDRSASDFLLYRMTGESLTNMSRGNRLTGYAWWTRALQMRRVAS